MDGRPEPAGDTPALALIAAVASNGVIGVANGMPWRLPEDSKRFRALTTGHAVIMGRRTWESLGRALPDRQNIVVTRRSDLIATGAQVVRSLGDALRAVTLPLPAYCIGGAELYAQALPLAQRLELTLLDRAFDGDTRFPDFDRTLWRETRRDTRRAPEGYQFSFVTLDRK
jgi:dihydrofolate reductase